MKILNWAFYLSLAITLGLFALKWTPGNELLYYSEIESNFNEQLDKQKLDLENFQIQLSELDNPFDITSSNDFLKLVYENGSLIYWSDNDPIPGYGTIKNNDSLYTVIASNGVFIIRRASFISKNTLIETFSLLPLVEYPPVNNQYLKTYYNPKLFEDLPVTLSNDGFSVVYEGRMQVRITLDDQAGSNIRKYYFLFLIFTISLFSVILFFQLARGRNGGFRILLALFLAVITRAVIFYLVTLWGSELEIFDPVYYTVGGINRSLGDYLLNATVVFLLSITIFRWIKWIRLAGLLTVKHVVVKVTATLLISAVLLLSACLVFFSAWNIFENSQINLDVYQSIEFDQFRFIAYIILSLNALSFLMFFSVLQKFFHQIDLKVWVKLSLFFLMYLAVYVVFGNEFLIYGGLTTLVWGTVEVSRLSYQFFNLRYQTFLYIVLILALVSSIYTYCIYGYFERDELIAKEKYANRLLIKNDILGEYYLSQTMLEIERDPYIRSRLLSRLLARQNIREKIKRQFLSSYFDKYEIDVHLFGPDGRSFDENAPTYQEWEVNYQIDYYKTDYKGLFFIDGKTDNIRNKYLCFLSVESGNNQLGYIILELVLKKYIPTSIFPELLVEGKYFLGDGTEYDYAVYLNNEILYKQGSSGFEATLLKEDFDNPELYTSGIIINDVHYYGQRTSDGRIIIIASETYLTAAIFANFSFTLLIFLFASGLVFIFLRIFRARTHLNLSTKIQLYLGFSFILPMFFIAIALLNTLNVTYQEEIDRNFLNRSYNVAENLTEEMENLVNNRINRDDFANRLSEVATLIQNDLNIYDESGILIASSQPEIFRLELLGQQVKPIALQSLKFRKEQVLIADEEIGSLQFKSSYIAMRSYEDGSLLGILSMPYFESKNHLRRQQIVVFNDLISIFTVIFLFSLYAGNAIVTSLVNPLKVIAARIKKTSLQDANQPIQYDASDEIGSLVREYNMMLISLEENKYALAESQKESAWKEIARQVAHEIKNPLTPMRLKIQQMMRSKERDDPEYKSLNSLIEQIDTLSEIADSFSAFAKMPAPKNETFNIRDLLEKVAGLFSSSEVDIYMHLPEEPVFVFTDPNIIGRIFNNIILNGIQSVNEKHPVIDILMELKGKKIQISIQDNGEGIPEELREDIFTPYFSTKASGSGIGLAVAKKGIEHAGGNIWFETEIGSGTTFYIVLPMVESPAH